MIRIDMENDAHLPPTLCKFQNTLHVAESLPIFSGLNVWRWFPDASVNYALHAVKLPSPKEKL
jgi:hypothetical protein